MKSQKTIWAVALIVTGVMIAALMSIPVRASIEKSDLQGRLEKLSIVLEKKRAEYHIPGMAIAVVQGDKVIFARGFGVTDIEAKTPVTPETLFAIGSTTKAFTATLIGMLIDEGKMQWDDPVTKYMPYLQFPLENTDDQITLRDMLSHRSGYSRNDILWINGAASRSEILHNAIKAKAWTGFREKFNYNNVMFLAAGVASAKQAGSDWDTLLEQRLLAPLGMENSTSHYEEAQQNPNLSRGYIWREEAEEYQQLPMRNINNVGPAGSINSTVLDMAKWLRLQLANGTFEGRRLISEAQLLETRTSQIKVSDGVDYGLGWFLRDWQGQPVVEHGGSIDGFGAEVGFLPESDLGFVLLTNVTSTPLQQEALTIVWETLLGDTSQKDVRFYDEYAGEYIANFGPFKDTVFTFMVRDGVPAVDVPGQRVYDLKDPDEQGKWFFRLTDTIAISFDRGPKGKVAAMRMHQNGMDFDLPRKGVPIVAEIDPAKLQKYLGSYRSKIFEGNVEVIIQNHRLSLDIPNQMVIELHLPGADGRRHARIRPKMSIDFDHDEKGQITAFNVYRDGEKIDSAPRAAEITSALPTLEDIMALRQTERRKTALLKSGGFRFIGKITMVQAGISGKVMTNFEGTDRYRLDINLGKYGTIHTASNGERAASMGIQPYTEHKGKYLEQ
ncbi:MAG: beta-lactamase family protein, partial [Alphaproteobacteria bacterium]|nr:beta-lactamase family protein [Alphaproteobacteria bacterium]